MCRLQAFELGNAAEDVEQDVIDFGLGKRVFEHEEIHFWALAAAAVVEPIDAGFGRKNMGVEVAVGSGAPDDEAAGRGGGVCWSILCGFLFGPFFEFGDAGKAATPVGHVAEALFFELEGEVCRERNDRQANEEAQCEKQPNFEQSLDKPAHQN